MQLTWADLFLRVIPESLIFIWGICIISNNVISKKRYIIYCALMSIEVFIVRSLPIHFGVHTIITDIFVICLLIIAGFSINTAIRNTLLATLLLLISELFNTLLLQIANIDIEVQFKILAMRFLLMLPSLLCFILLIYLAKFLLSNKEGKINVIS